MLIATFVFFALRYCKLPKICMIIGAYKTLKILKLLIQVYTNSNSVYLVSFLDYYCLYVFPPIKVAYYYFKPVNLNMLSVKPSN